MCRHVGSFKQGFKYLELVSNQYKKLCLLQEAYYIAMKKDLNMTGTSFFGQFGAGTLSGEGKKVFRPFSNLPKRPNVLCCFCASTTHPRLYNFLPVAGGAIILDLENVMCILC